MINKNSPYKHILSKEEKILVEIIKNAYNQNYIISSDNYVYNCIDWQLLFHKSLEQRVFPLVFKSVKHLLPPKEKALYTKHYVKYLVDTKIKIKEAAVIMTKAHEAGLNPCIAKGFALSQIIYGTPYMRQFGDIDVYIDESQIVDMCRIMEQCGYAEELTMQLNSETIEVSDFSRYYLTRFDAKFVSNTKNFMFEIKSKCTGIDRIMMEHFMKTPVSVNIDNFHMNTFDPIHTILYLFVNTNTNFNTEYGIDADFTLRDLTDVYCFICKNPDFDYELLCKTAFIYNLEHVLKYVLSLVEKVFGPIDDFCDIKTYLKDVVEADEIVKWESDFLFRIFNRKERILERNRIRVNLLKEKKAAWEHYPIKLPQDSINIEECDFLCRTRLNSHLRLFNAADKEMYSDFFIDSGNLYICFSFDTNIRYNNLGFKISFLNVNALSDAIFKDIIICSSNGKSTSLKHSDAENVEVFSKIRGNIKNIAVKVPLSENNLYITDRIGRRKLLLYFSVISQDFENSHFTLYSWGGPYGLVTCVI